MAISPITDRLQGRSAAAANMALSLPQLASIAVGAALVDVVDYRWLSGAAVLVLSGTAASLLLGRTTDAVRPSAPDLTTTESGTLR